MPARRSDLARQETPSETDGEKTSRIQEIARTLTAEIAEGHYRVGDRFPLERNLQDRFEVGRHTVREALKLMAEQGLISRRQKTGTLVLSDRPIAPYVHTLRDLPGLLDFAHTTRLEIRHISRVTETSKLLKGYEGLPKGRWLRVAGLRRVRATNAALCWSEILVPDALAPPRDVIVNSSRALYEEVIRHNNLRLEFVEQVALVMILPRAMVDLFSAPENSAALLVKRRYVANSGDTFEISQNLYPAGRYELQSIFRQRP